jgi:hypothetical protein
MTAYQTAWLAVSLFTLTSVGAAWGQAPRDAAGLAWCVGAWVQVGGLWSCDPQPLSRSTAIVPPACDLVELLAASKEWAVLLGPPSWAVRNGYAEMTWTFRQIVGASARGPIEIEAAWRRAVEACRSGSSE